MAGLTLPRLPKLSKLSGLQALLLMGGAFVFAVLVWATPRYKIVVDRTSAAPKGAVLAATIFDRLSEDWLIFEARLPEKARQALSQADGVESVTLFAIPGEGADLNWGLLETLNSVTAGAGWNKIRIVPRGTSAVGYLSFGGRTSPFEATVSRGLIQARIGLEYRGPSPITNLFARGRRLLAPLNQQSQYIEKPSGVSWDKAAGLLSHQLQRFQPLANLWRLPGHVELTVSSSETGALNPFVLYYQPKIGAGSAEPALETYAKELLSESSPIGFKVTMPDNTEMVELRRDADSVLTERKKIKGFGERAVLKAAEGKHQIDIFYAVDGEAWMSNDFKLIQAAFTENMGLFQPIHACEAGGKDGFAAFTGKSLESWPYLQGIQRLTFSLHSLESGLFTTCGYFIP